MIFWIASYPKSGNTWLRSLLTAYYFSKDGTFDQNLLSKIKQFPRKEFFKNFDYNSKVVTDTSRFWIPAQDEINLDNNLKFFKTHNILGSINGNNFTNKKNTVGAIYIVRDPRNVITSFKNHYDFTLKQAYEAMTNQNYYIHESKELNDFGDFQLISSWEKNYQSWKKQNIFETKLIRYEDLLEETYYTFKQIINFIDRVCNLNNKFDKDKAINSIRTTNFSKLKNMEQKEGFIESVSSKIDKKKIPFFHLGADNDWKKILSVDYQNKIKTKFIESMKELNYVK